MNIEKFNKSQYKGQIREAVKLAEGLRSDKDNPVDVSFDEVIKEKFGGATRESFFADLGIDPNTDTISNIQTMPDDDVRWLIPELIREPLVLGYRKAPIWNNITASEEQISGLSQVMPSLNMSDAVPARVGEGETIPLGAISYGSKKFSIYKVGRGIKIPYEVLNYVSLNVIGIFLQDFGVKMGHALDTLAIDCIINGEQADGSESAPVIGTTTGVASTKAYSDFLRAWIRGARMGRKFSTIIGGEAAALSTLDLTPFKTNSDGSKMAAGVPTTTALTLKTPVPASAEYYIHGNIPANQEILLDKAATLLKFNAQPLMIESDKVVSNQTIETYASMTTGFAKLFTDGALIMDASKAFASYGFPTYMDVDPFENVVFE